MQRNLVSYFLPIFVSPGHTGAKILSKGELSMGIQAWAKQEQFTQAKKVQGGFGEYLLKKMGWNQGEGLGKEKNGEVDPLTLDIKMDKKGLMAAEELMRGRKTKNRGETYNFLNCPVYYLLNPS